MDDSQDNTTSSPTSTVSNSLAAPKQSVEGNLWRESDPKTQSIISIQGGKNEERQSYMITFRGRLDVDLIRMCDNLPHSST